MSKLWPIHSHELKELPLHEFGWEYFTPRLVSAIEVSHDGSYLACSTANGLSVEIWSLTSFPALILNLSPHDIISDGVNQGKTRSCQYLRISKNRNSHVAAVFSSHSKAISSDASVLSEIFVWSAKSGDIAASIRLQAVIESCIFVSADYLIVGIEGILNPVIVCLSRNSFQLLILTSPSFNLAPDAAWKSIDELSNIVTKEKQQSSSPSYHTLSCSVGDDVFIITQVDNNHDSHDYHLVKVSIDASSSGDSLIIKQISNITQVFAASCSENSAVPIIASMCVSLKYGYLMISTDNAAIALINISNHQDVSVFPMNNISVPFTAIKISHINFFHDDTDCDPNIKLATTHGSRLMFWVVKPSAFTVYRNNEVGIVSNNKNKLYHEHFISFDQVMRTGGVMITAIRSHPQRPLIFAIDRLNRTHFLQKNILSDFPGPQYPIGFKLIQRVVPYYEAEDELDIVPPSVSSSISSMLSSSEYQPEVPSTTQSILTLSPHPILPPDMIPLNIDSFKSMTRSKSHSIKQKAHISEEDSPQPPVIEEKILNEVEEYMPAPKRLKSGEFMKSILDARAKGEYILSTCANPAIEQVKIAQLRTEAIEALKKISDQKEKERLKRDEARKRKDELQEQKYRMEMEQKVELQMQQQLLMQQRMQQAPGQPQAQYVLQGGGNIAYRQPTNPSYKQPSSMHHAKQVYPRPMPYPALDNTFPPMKQEISIGSTFPVDNTSATSATIACIILAPQTSRADKASTSNDNNSTAVDDTSKIEVDPTGESMQ